MTHYLQLLSSYEFIVTPLSKIQIYLATWWHVKSNLGDEYTKNFDFLILLILEMSQILKGHRLHASPR